MPAPKNRIPRLQNALPVKTAGLITNPINRRYCTGFPSSAGTLLLCNDEALFLADSRYIEAAKQAITSVPVEEQTDRSEQITAFCKRHKIRRLLIETDHTTLSEHVRLRKVLPKLHIERDGLLSKELARLRLHKSPEEIECIEQAQRIAEVALTHILEHHLKAGVTERELAIEIDFYMLRHGAEAISFETIVVAGENGANPHGVPGDRPLQRGDLVTMDFGAVVNGMHSDMTRTVAVGTCSDEARAVYETVLRAQEEALQTAAPGLFGEELDAAARDFITEAGYGEYFRHGTGHGVGYDVHEAPSAGPKSKDILTPGMVVTVEPGIYIPGKHGVRIEDMILITGAGCENLTQAGKELIVVD